MTGGSPGGNVCFSWLRQRLHTLPLLCPALWPPPSLPNPPVPHVRLSGSVMRSSGASAAPGCTFGPRCSAEGILFAIPSRPNLPSGRKECCPLREADVKMGVSSQTCWMHLAPSAQKDTDFGDGHCPISPTGLTSLLLLLPPLHASRRSTRIHHTYTSHIAPQPLKKADAGCNQRG